MKDEFIVIRESRYIKLRKCEIEIDYLKNKRKIEDYEKAVKDLYKEIKKMRKVPQEETNDVFNN